MKTTSLIFFGAIIAVSAVTAFAAEPVGTIVSFSGKATATAQNGEIRNLELKAPVFLNDRIKTDTASSLQIMFLDDSVLSQGEKSEMTIDEYVYSPKVKGDNKCTLSLTKGVFRAVTARITSLNPDRFKVKTRMATIGIRGCELAFTVSQTSENIYILSLPDGKSISITIDPVAAAGMNLTGVVNKEAAIEILQAGTMISIQEGEGVTQRFITNQEAVDLIEQLSNPDDTPPPPGDGGTGGQDDNTLNDTTGSANQNDNEQVLNETEDEVIAGLTTTTTTTTTPTPTTTTQPPAPTLVYTKMGPAMEMGWEWGVWADQAGTLTKVEFKAASLLTDLQAAALFGSYSLTAPGEAAAIVTYNSSSYLVSGACIVNVNMGTAGGPGIWSVSSTLLDGKGTEFGLMIAGDIDASGVFTGVLPSSTLPFIAGASTPYSNPDNGSSASANLIGSGGTPSGIIGCFNCTFGSGAATVNGGFGAPAAPF